MSKYQDNIHFLLPKKRATLDIRGKLEVFLRIKAIQEENFSKWVVVVVAKQTG